MKTQFWYLFLILFIAILAGCTNSGKKSEITTEIISPTYKWGDVSGKTITVWGGTNDIDRVYLKKIFARYEKLTGNKIEITQFSKQDIEKKFPAIFESDSAVKPDIIFSYGGMNIEHLEPLENFYDFTNAPWIDDITDAALTQAIFGGHVIGLPYGEASISGTLYNKEIFHKYSIDIPRNQKEFLDVCEKLLSYGVIPVYLPYTEISALLYQFPMDSIFKNETVLEALNSGSLSYGDIPEMKLIVEWYKTMATKGYFGRNYIHNGWDGMDRAMKTGKYAMMLCWDTWLYTDFTGNPAKFGLMPAFVGVPKEGSFEGPNIRLAIVNKNGSNIEAALDLITFMADPYNYNETFKDIYTAPIFNNQNGSLSTPQYLEAERMIEKHFYNSTSWMRIRGFSQMDACYIQIYMRDRNYSAEQCLSDMDEARMKRAKNRSN